MFGNGSYELVSDGNVVASGGSFNGSESTDFCVEWKETQTGRLSTVLGAEDELDKSTVLFPTPGNGLMNVKLQNEKSGILSLEVTDLSGRTVFREISKKEDAVWEQTIDMSEMEAGIYMVEISMGGERIVKKWIKE